jgi:hypothetical protein
MTSTKVKCACVSKKEIKSGNKENPIQTAIELEVPYDRDSVYFRLSGGTSVLLNTINQEAADLFKIGESYDLVISPSVD